LVQGRILRIEAFPDLDGLFLDDPLDLLPDYTALNPTKIMLFR
jgi:hypothetical protein